MNKVERQTVREVAITAVASSGFALIAHSSPGNRERLALLDDGDVRITPDGLAILRALGRPFSDLTEAYLSVEAVLVIAAAASAVVVLLRTGMSIDGKASFRCAALLTGFSSIFAGVIRVGDLFAHDGLWHILPVRLIAWWSLVLRGAGIGTPLGSLSGNTTDLPPASEPAFLHVQGGSGSNLACTSLVSGS